MNIVIFACFLVSFVVTLVSTPYWIKIAHKIGIVAVDMHKVDKKKKVAELGGIVVVFGFIMGVLLYIALDTFYIESTNLANLERDVQILACLTTILIISIIGLVDDILGWKIGLRQYQKPILVLLATIPMVVVNAGHSITTIPFVGSIDIGILYALLVVPLAITGAANGFNMIAGYNGLEAGMGMIMLTFLSYMAWLNNYGWVAVLGLCMVASLFAFYIFNKYPSKIFPGDTVTYTVGALIAIMAIMGNIEKIALIIFIPYFIELILKLRGKLQKESFATVKKDGSLEVKGIYGLEHLVTHIRTKLGRKTYEKDVVFSLYLIQGFFIVIACLAVL
ncbi:glycosyl transferase family 4 [archaeon]|jgi:UDP-N-acetylglucosamine--dolichyl-phosphate N-acetylglucosaminephosphotransferase|nr:glycosyl transferase family 4 [archaeon]MBT4441414.1 glycosyl transferase family 4 [archaeon]